MELSAFFKENLAVREEKTVKLSDRLPAFRIRPITAEEDQLLREKSTVYVRETPEVDPNKYLIALAAASVSEPDLDAEELQNSYHVLGREALLCAMLYKDELDALCAAITREGFADLVDTAKK